MKTALKNAVVFCGLVLGTSVSLAYADSVLLQQSNLTYLGGFKVPAGKYGCSDDTCSFSYGGNNIAFNPLHNSLYMSGHPWDNKIAEIAIPAIVNSTDINALNTATILQNFVDLSQGNMSNIGAGFTTISNGGHAGGILVNGSKLLISAFGGYDASYQAVYTHFTGNADWTTNGPGFSGMQIVAPQPQAPQAGFVSGYMAWIPKTWQAQLGGTALTGQSNIPIITRTSLGPSSFVFNPDQVGTGSATKGAPVVYYPSAHWTLGNYGTQNPNINQSSQIKGVVFPEGTGSVLFFGRHGVGVPCYGFGTTIASQAATSAQIQASVAANGTLYTCGSATTDGSGNDYCCYDPSDGSKGTHGYPYVHQVWAYNAADMVAVKNGSKQPWDIFPYAVWNYALPFQTESRSIAGAAYDSATQRIYISQIMGNSDLPVVHVFQVKLAGTSVPTSVSNLKSSLLKVGSE